RRAIRERVAGRSGLREVRWRGVPVLHRIDAPRRGRGRFPRGDGARYGAGRPGDRRAARRPAGPGQPVSRRGSTNLFRPGGEMPEPFFEGACVALITPFDERGVNERTLRELVRFHHDGGTDALLVCGSTGEAATMTADEQRLAIEIVVDENAGRLPVVAGGGGSDTAVVARLAASARDAGAEALLVSAPPYNKPPQ